MKLINTNNQGAVEVTDELAKELLETGIWKKAEEPKKNTRPKATKES